MPKGVLGGGNFIVDYVKMVDVYPAEQALANIGREFIGSGGAPYNVLVCLAKLGGGIPLKAIGLIGNDEAGRFILNDCQANGIDTNQLRITLKAPTSHTQVMVVESTGKRTFFHQRGANALLSPDHFDFTGLEGWHFHFGYLLLLDGLDQPDEGFGTGTARVLARAKEAGLTTSIDLVSEDSDRFGSLVPPALKYADVAFMNEFEASRLTGLAFTEDGRFAAGVAQTLGFQGRLVVHWAGGAATIFPGESAVTCPSVHVPQDRIAATVGCGDAFAAGFLQAHLRGDAALDCLRLGALCAASCAHGSTCTDHILDEAGCRDLGARYLSA